jgi:hypothetical protein
MMFYVGVKLVSRSGGGAQIHHVWEQGAEVNIWAQDRNEISYK